MSETFVVYSCRDEVLVCISRNEEELKRIYFTEGGRDLDDYDREEYPNDAILDFVSGVTVGTTKT